MSTTKLDIPVQGNFPPLRASLSARNGVDGVLLVQGDQFVWVDVNGYDNLVSAIDAMLEGDQDELGKLGHLFRHQLQPAVTPAKWRRDA